LNKPASLGFGRKRAPEGAAERVRDWTRSRFSLAADAAVMVAQVDCAVPGCPPLETVVAFWSADATRHQFKMFKPVQGVVADDLPYAWLKDALVVPEGFEYDCC